MVEAVATGCRSMLPVDLAREKDFLATPHFPHTAWRSVRLLGIVMILRARSSQLLEGDTIMGLLSSRLVFKGQGRTRSKKENKSSPRSMEVN